MSQAAQPIYTSRIIKASALMADTRLLLSEWNLDLSVAENLERAQRENVFGKASRRRVGDVLRIFRQRYFDDADVGRALVILTQCNAPAQWLDPLLYFFSAQNDRTLRDIVIEVLYARRVAGYVDVDVTHVMRAIKDWAAEGKTTTHWTDKPGGTIERVAQGALAALRDFGVLQGAVNKRIAPIYLPVESLSLMALWLYRRERSGERVLHHDDWKLFFLPAEGVERFFIEAHQEHLMSFYAAGSVVRLEFPVQTLGELAHVLVNRIGA